MDLASLAEIGGSAVRAAESPNLAILQSKG
jgi:hypothetical protein